MLRVFKLQLEAKIKHDLDTDLPIVQWMARWAAMAISRFRVGKDGRTAYERKRGRRCRMPIATFGEKVLYKPLDHQKDKGGERRVSEYSFG